MTNTAGIAMTTIQAPWVNLVTSTTTSTSAVSAAPPPLMARARWIRRRAARSRSCARLSFQCFTMPAWDSVNDTNTPMMYSWMSRSVDALNDQISAIVSNERMMMPLLYTSRSPRRENWRGRKPSWPRMEARIGKPLNAVLAASTRIAAVNAWTR